MQDTGKFPVYERNGERIAVPATEKGYEIFRELVGMIVSREGVQPTIE